jgi:hypothetical protein
MQEHFGIHPHVVEILKTIVAAGNGVVDIFGC